MTDLCRMRRGFTLIELMVAMTILAIIVTAIGSCVVAGIRIWDNAKNVNFARANFLVDINRVAGELRRSVDIPAIGFEGHKLQFSFPLTEKNLVARITYMYDPEKKILMRRQTTLQAILDKKDDNEYSEEEFVQLEDFSASYFNFDTEKSVYQWTDNWPKAQGIFRAVRLEGKFKGENFVKTVFLPIFS